MSEEVSPPLQENIDQEAKETHQEEEKEQDTAESNESHAAVTENEANNATNNATSNATSNATNNATTEQDTSQNADAPAAPKGSGKKKKKEKEPKEPVKETVSNLLGDLDGENQEEASLPENVFPLFMTSKTQEIYTCKCDEDVTEENPFKFIAKTDILEDMRMRAAVCDFHPFKQAILDYPGEDILISYDAQFKYGQNFIIALTEEAKELLLKKAEEEEEEPEEEEEEEEDDTIYQYVPPESKEWVSQGSEIEIDECIVTETRKKIKVSIKRIRSSFGAPFAFEDRNVADAKDGAINCESYEDTNFGLSRIELDNATQAVPVQMDVGTQTDWKYPRNANTQCYPRELNDEEQAEVFQSDTCQNAFVKSADFFQQALQQNDIMNIFHVDWLHLGSGDDIFGAKSDNHLKEFQSFTDLQFSKDKVISCIKWYPNVKGVIATSVTEQLTFNERVDQAARVIMAPKLILFWNFTDPIHPQLILEAPEDIQCFDFSPSNPDVVAGGCLNGQIALWDISDYTDRLKTMRTSRNKKRTVLPGFEDPNAMKTPIVRYSAVSSIDHSHKSPITHLQWLPDHMMVSKMGVPQENSSRICSQLMTCATDHCVLFWDIKAPKHQIVDEKSAKNPMGVPDTFKYLDLTWKPLLKVTLSKSEPGGDHAPTVFSISEKQGDRSSLDFDADGTVSAKQNSGRERTLQSVKPFVFVGTEDGEIVYADWMPQKDQDSGKVQTPKPAFYHVQHDGPVVAMDRSPFFKDILLTVGGWTLAIWKEGISSGPILVSAPNTVRLTGGKWSPTRPGVFYIAKIDGSIDVWDVLDKTHEPTLTQSVSPSAIQTISPKHEKGKQQFIAVGDIAGTLHILEIPHSLKTPLSNEVNAVSNYFEREVKRRAFVVERWNYREKEKRELEAEQKRKAGGLAAAMQAPSDDEVDLKMRMEYQAYLDEEHNFLRELGLLQEEEVET